jgi:hypothetical protein
VSCGCVVSLSLCLSVSLSLCLSVSLSLCLSVSLSLYLSSLCLSSLFSRLSSLVSPFLPLCLSVSRLSVSLSLCLSVSRLSVSLSLTPRSPNLLPSLVCVVSVRLSTERVWYIGGIDTSLLSNSTSSDNIISEDASTVPWTVIHIFPMFSLCINVFAALAACSSTVFDSDSMWEITPSQLVIITLSAFTSLAPEVVMLAFTDHYIVLALTVIMKIAVITACNAALLLILELPRREKPESEKSFLKLYLAVLSAIPFWGPLLSYMLSSRISKHSE